MFYFFNLWEKCRINFLRIFLKIFIDGPYYLSIQLTNFMTRGAQREREKARAEARNKKHEKKGAGGNANERRERDAQIMKEKQARAEARKAAAGS